MSNIASKNGAPPNADDRMLSALKAAIKDPATVQAAKDDFANTFIKVGVKDSTAFALAELIIVEIGTAQSAVDLENTIFDLYREQRVKFFQSTLPLPEALSLKLTNRAQIICDQILPYFAGISGTVLDYGAGDCQVTTLLRERGVTIEAADVVDYRASGTAVDFTRIEHGKLDKPNRHYAVGLATNVLHHASNNAQILADLDRLVADRIIIIETVPEGKTEEEQRADRGRTFLNDWFYNRTFHPNANIPVPGTYETIEGWKERFREMGWRLTECRDLGRDQPLIADRHVLYVLEKRPAP